MGFYVNVHAKKGCSRQINTAWKKQFGNSLIFTPARIKKEIEFIKNDPKQQHLLYVDDIFTWNNTFPIHANGRGQIFLRAYGYGEDEAEEFSKEGEELRNKVQFVLSHRLLFEKITGLQDAVDTLNIEINGDFVENGKLEYYEQPMFENLPQKHNHPVFKRCLLLDRPDLWESFLIYEDEKSKWNELRNKVVIDSVMGRNATIWQRCESIATARDGVDYGLSGRYRDGKMPNEFDVMKAIISTPEEFNEYLINIKRIA
jgi:hypothetical protein